MGLEKRAGSSASHTFSLPFLRSHIPSVTGLSRTCWGYQRPHVAPEQHALAFGVLRLRGCDATPEEEPQKCLNLSPYLSLPMSDLRVLGFVLSFFPPSHPSIFLSSLPSFHEKWKRCLGQSLVSKAPGFFTSHSQWQFHNLEWEVGHLFLCWFFFFCTAGDWTQSFTCARQALYH